MKRLLWPTLVGLAAIGSLAVLRMDGAPPQSQPAGAPDYEALLARRARSVSLRNVRAKDAFEYLARTSGLKFLTNWDNIEKSGADEAIIALELRDVSIQQVTDYIITHMSIVPGWVDYIVTEAGIVVDTDDGFDDMPPLEWRCRLSDIAGGASSATDGPLLLEMVRELHLESSSESDFVAADSTRIDAGWFVAKESPLYVQSVKRFINQLKTPLLASADDDLSREYGVMTKLRERRKVQEDKAKTVVAIAEELGSDAGVNVFLDVALIMGVGQERDSVVPASGQAITYLDLLESLSSCGDREAHVDYLIRSNVVEITSNVRVSQDYSVRVYDVDAMKSRLKTNQSQATARNREVSDDALLDLVRKATKALEYIEFDFGNHHQRRTVHIPAPIRIWKGRLILTQNWRGHREVLKALGLYPGQTGSIPASMPMTTRQAR